MTERIDAEAVFTAEWTLAPDGLYERASARVVLLDEFGRVLLIRSHSDDGRPWWFTPGGGVDGQTPRIAAARELREETGIPVDPDTLIGPIWRRTALFDFLGRRVRQHELFYLSVLADPPAAENLSTEGWTPLERDSIDAVRWLRAAEVAALPEAVYPEELRTLVHRLHDHGWDGVLHDLGTAEDPI